MLNHKSCHRPAVICSSGMLMMATNTEEATRMSSKHRHRLRVKNAHRGDSSRSSDRSDSVDWRTRRGRRRGAEEPVAAVGVATKSKTVGQGLVASPKGIANNSLKFKRKCQSIDQLRNFSQSQSTMRRLVVQSILLLLLLVSSGHVLVSPVSGAAIAAVTNDPLVMNRSGSQMTSSAAGAGAGATVAAAASTTAAAGAIPSPIIRLPSNSLIKYTAYRDVSILHFQVPRDTRSLYFSFRAHEEFKSAFPGNKCDPRNITLHMKARAYPVISPENIQFPRHFFDQQQREKIHSVEFKSNSVEMRLQVDGPLPGSWFGVAFISWTDPKQDRIEQQGLTVSCETVLTSEMSVQRADPEIIMDGSYRENTLRDNQSEPYAYKFYVPIGVEYVRLHFNVLETCTTSCPSVQVAVAADTFPNEENHLDRFAYWTNITSTNQLQFFTVEDLWHYIDVSFVDAEGSTGEGPEGEDVTSRAGSRTVNEFKYNMSVEFVYVNDTDSEDEVSLLPRITYETHSLMRQTYREFFMYDFDLLPDSYNETPQYINISAATPIQLQFSIGDTYDIGGTLSFAVAFYTASRSDYGETLKVTTAASAAASSKELSGPVAERLVDDSGRPEMTLIVCMRVGIVGIPRWPNQCVYGRHVFEPVIVINTTSDLTSTGLVHVPYPETGRWLISMGLFCPNDTSMEDVVTVDEKVMEERKIRSFVAQNVNLMDEMIHPLCACQRNREALKGCVLDETRHCLYEQLNVTVLKEIRDCMLSVNCVQNHQNIQKRYETFGHVYGAAGQRGGAGNLGDGKSRTITLMEDGEENCNAKLVFTIASNPCVAGRCGQYGKCYHYMSGGVVYSTCLCNKGYRGWDCTEDSEVPDSWTILLASLLLTLSNLLFIPSIYFAVQRKYYTEAVIYFFAMFFSSFYHACDSGEDEYSFCLVKISVLQFSDFYCGLLAIWVTLIAMANLNAKLVSLLHMLGAIILAFGTELNKQSLWVFLTPAVTGLCIITTSWGLRCYRTRKWFPSRKYYSVYLPIGSVLVMVGLCCYAFLQTKQNYHVVHSIWHMVMALSLLCLLPSQKSFIPAS